MKSLFALIWIVSLPSGNLLFGQAQSLYNLPGTYRFDYGVEQVLINSKHAGDTSVLHFFYTKSGDYGAAEISRKSNTKGNLLLLFTRDGYAVIFDEHKKNITVISIRKLLSDLTSLTKYIRLDSLIANMREKTEGKNFQSVKTGKSKPIGSYTSEEYMVSDTRGSKASVWCAKVDFLTLKDYIVGAGGGNILKMMSTRLSTHPLFQALFQPQTLVTSLNARDSAGNSRMEMLTVSINQISKEIQTSGYQVDNFSNMTLPEIFQAEMRKRNN
jgi:hypothetical protein